MLIDPSPLSLDMIASTYAGSIVYPPGGTFGPRIQQDIQLVMLYTGEMSIAIDGARRIVAPGHAIILYPGREESFTFSKSEESWHRWISVHIPAWEHDTVWRIADTDCIPISEEMNRLLDLMLLVQPQTATTDPIMRTLGLSALQLFPLDLLRERRLSEKPPAVYAALTWIHDHYAEEITLHEIAREASVSPEHLVRLFKRFERTTPARYLWQHRIKQAIGLLTNTGLSVNEISLRCGFKTSHHFARMIKQSTGLTASELRQRSWGGTRGVLPEYQK